MGVPGFVRLRRGRRGQDGQALVEFSLTAIAFLFLLVMIIEVGRIFGAYVLLQHATRAGARYAVTGQWYEKYANDLEAGWTPASDDPLQQIPPCWPRFYDESAIDASLTDAANTADAFDYYEPYRNPRTCSVEEVVLRNIGSMVPLVPSAEPDEDGYYMLRVSGVADDKYPNTGTFTRAQDNPNEYHYASYFPLSEFDGDNAGLSPGFAGIPQQKVVVQMNYRLPLITPLLRNIAPSIMLRGTAVMTNEPYGSTSLQREAILPPELVGLTALAEATEHDLDVTSVALVAGDVEPLLPGGTADFDVEVVNLGQVIIRAYFDVKLYASLDPITGTPTGPDVTEVGSVTVPGLNGETATTVSYHLDYDSFPGAGTYYLYAWADAGEIVSEPDEENNVGMYSPVQVGEYNDLAVGKTASASEVADGEQVTYTVTVTNSEYGIERDDVVVTDQLPPGATYVSDSGGGAYDPVSGVWTVGTLAPDTTAQLTIAATLTGTGGEFITNTATFTSGDDDPGNDSASADVTISYPETDLAITKVASATEVDNGDQVTYTLTASNQGAIDATNVVVTDLLPTGAAYESHSGGDYDSGSGVWAVGDLAPGASAQLTIVATLSGENEEVVTNTATIAADQPDPVTTDNTASADVMVISAVDVSLEASAVYVGRSGSWYYSYDNYELTVIARNEGTSDASGVSVTISRSSGDVQFDYDVSGDCSSSGGTYCDFGTIPAGETRQLVYQVRISTYYASGSYNVDFTLDTDDENASTETYQRVTLSTALASTDLSLSKAVSVDEVSNGGEVTYTLTVSNPSSGFDATNVVVTDVLPGAAAHVSHSGPGSYSVSAGVWTVGDLDAGDSATLQITATITGSIGAVITNTATVAADQIDLNLLNNVASASVTVVEITSVNVSLSVDSSQYWNDYYRITVRATNHGSTDASGVSVDISYSRDVSYYSTTSVPPGSSYHGEPTFSFGTIRAGNTETLVYLVRLRNSGREYGYFTLHTDQLNLNPNVSVTERIR